MILAGNKDLAQGKQYTGRKVVTETSVAWKHANEVGFF